MYYIQNIPVLFNAKTWISVRTPKHFIINSVHETLNYEEVISLCTLKNSNYKCEPNLIAISHKEEKTCEYKLYLSQFTKVVNFFLSFTNYLLGFIFYKIQYSTIQ